MIPEWLSNYRITGTWEEHRARGSAGGIDWGTPVGTVIYAPSDGYVDFRYFPDGSSVIRVRRADGSATEFLHGHITRSGPVAYLDAIGTSDGRVGADGAGPSDGPHLHVHDVTAAGIRVPPFSTIAVQLASLSVTPIFEQQQEDDMKPIVIKRTDGSAEWSLVAPWITGTDGRGNVTTKGYRVTTDEATGKAWSRMFGIAGVPTVQVGRNDYVKCQAEAGVLFDLWAANK